MTQLYEKMLETDAGRWAAFVHKLLYSHGEAIANMYMGHRSVQTRNPKELLFDLADYLENIAFKELDKEAKDQHSWINDLRERIK